MLPPPVVTAGLAAVDGEALIELLQLKPHPEGGHYRQTWADDTGSAIYYLLLAGEVSAWHRVLDRTEVWHFYAGTPLELHVVADGAGHAVQTTVLGTDLAPGARPQAVVSPGAWQRARSLGGWSLTGCTVAPPFSFDAFELAPEGHLPD